MPKTVILHIAGEDPVVGELERDPQPTDTFVVVSNLRKRDGKEVAYIATGVDTVLFPWHRVTFIEVMRNADDRTQTIDFFRQ